MNQHRNHARHKVSYELWQISLACISPSQLIDLATRLLVTHSFVPE